MELVTYCGLYCDLCAARTRMPRLAAALRAAMTKASWPFWVGGYPHIRSPRPRSGECCR